MTSIVIEPLLLKLMSSIVLFQNMEREVIVDLLRCASKAIFSEGELVFEEGSPGQSLYIVLHGKFEVFTKVAGSDAHIATISPGEHFGEVALVTERPRMASVRAMEKSVALRLTRAAIFFQPNVAIPLLKNMSCLMADHLSDMNKEVLLLDMSRQHHEREGKSVSVEPAPEATRNTKTVRNMG
jgi:CRP-like cAMP-binding protein